MKHYIGQKVMIDYRNNRKPEEATIVREDLGHFFAQHKNYKSVMLDVTACEMAKLPCTPIITIK